MTDPIYKRILLKLSGESLQGEDNFGIDPNVLDKFALEIKNLQALNIEIGIVLGGGNLFRGAKLAKAGINRVVGDHMGMMATIMNGLAMRDALQRADINAKLMSSIQLNGICDTYNWAEAIKMLKEQRVVIFAGGTGNPFFTTDSAACLRAIEIEADVVFKATKVDGVYDSDPVINPNAKLFDKLSYDQVIEKELKVMDLAAFTLARDHKIPIRVFNMNKQGALKNAVLGLDEGTLITSSI